MKKLMLLVAIMMTALHTHAETLLIQNEEGQPLAGADVIVGQSIDNPIVGNKLKTDVNGQVAIPADWKGATLPVTVIADGYLRTTFLPADNRGTILQVHSQDVRSQIEVKGKTTNFPNLKKDGKVDFALVFPAVRRRQLSQFDVNAVVSPEVDEIKIITETVAVPSNLTLPEQKENYVLPITLDKPVYRMYFKQPGQYRMTAMHGQFPLKQVVNDLRDGKSFYEVLNYFKYIGGGQRDLTVNESMIDQDVPVNQIPFNKEINVKAPALAADQVMLSAALVDQAGLYFPSDLKNLKSGETAQLLVPADSNKTYVASLLMPKAEAQKIGGVRPTPSQVDQSPELGVKLLFNRLLGFLNLTEPKLNDGPGGLSVALTESNGTPQFLSLIGRPTLNNGKLTLAVPTVPAGIAPVATYLILSEVEYKDAGQYQLERRYRLWELYQMGWASEVQLPNVAESLDPNKNYRWEVLFMGRESGHTELNGEYFLDGITHVSRNALDL